MTVAGAKKGQAGVGEAGGKGKGKRQWESTCQVCRSRVHTSSCTFSCSCLPSFHAVCPPIKKRSVPCRATWQPPRAAGAVMAAVLLHVHLCSSVSYSHTSLKYLWNHNSAQQLQQYKVQLPQHSESTHLKKTCKHFCTMCWWVVGTCILAGAQHCTVCQERKRRTWHPLCHRHESLQIRSACSCVQPSCDQSGQLGRPSM